MKLASFQQVKRKTHAAKNRRRVRHVENLECQTTTRCFRVGLTDESNASLRKPSRPGQSVLDACFVPTKMNTVENDLVNDDDDEPHVHRRVVYLSPIYICKKGHTSS